MNVYRKARGSEASMVVETDSVVEERIIEKIKALGNIKNIEEIIPPMKGE